MEQQAIECGEVVTQLDYGGPDQRGRAHQLTEKAPPGLDQFPPVPFRQVSQRL